MSNTSYQPGESPLPEQYRKGSPYPATQTPRDSSAYNQTPASNSAPLFTDKNEADGSQYPPARDPPEKRRTRWILFALLAVVIMFLVVFLPVYFTVIKPKQNQPSAANSGSTGNSGSPPPGGGVSNPDSPTGATTGGEGSTIIADNGVEFLYTNPHGGFWVADPNDPFSNNARPNSWTPPLNQTWDWAKDRVFGVNLGGLFVLEPFISPAIFQKYPGTVDEYTLHEAMRADVNGGFNALEEHYKTFITEKDIAEIASAGLNWIRLPIPHWAVQTFDGEPFLERVCWKYILRLLGWSRKYGLRVKIDLHTVPGSQNGYNHSGKLGTINFMHGVMGIANAQRTLDIIRVLVEFFAQPEYQHLIGIFGIVNEAYAKTIGQEQLVSFYLLAHDTIRGITGYGEGKGPYISIHDGFTGIGAWAGVLAGSDRVIMDYHPYFSFSGAKNDAPVAVPGGGVWPKQACEAWGPAIRTSQKRFGVTISGEYSNGMNDCGFWLKGVANGVNANYGDCTAGVNWLDSTNWDPSVKSGLLEFALASMDTTMHSFFWTWKIGPRADTGIVGSPLWSYQLGLQGNWMPQDPRDSVGKCASLTMNEDPFDGVYEPWMTGAAGAGIISASLRDAAPWPPATLFDLEGAPVTSLPVYTRTAAIITMPGPTPTAAASKSIDFGDGWFNDGDTAPMYTKIAGCVYPDAYNGVGAAVPTGCGNVEPVVGGGPPTARR